LVVGEIPPNTGKWKEGGCSVYVIIPDEIPRREMNKTTEEWNEREGGKGDSNTDEKNNHTGVKSVGPTAKTNGGRDRRGHRGGGAEGKQSGA